MAKPRCKNLRNITVGDVEYKWLAERNPLGAGVHLKIWNNKKKLIFDLKLMRHAKIRQVTPSIVKKIIIDVDWIETK